jgi:hypothetical protein
MYMVSTTCWKKPGSGLLRITHASAFLLARTVVLIRWRTWTALDSGKVRLATVQMYEDGLGTNGMAKKVTEGVDQHCCLRRALAVAIGILATR